MRCLLASTCLTPLALMTIAAPVHAETTIGAKQTTPVVTSTANNGAADDIKITNAGSIELTSGSAVTIDSPNKVTNEGKIVITNADNAAGILAQPGMSGEIVNSATGKITVDETYAPADADNDGDLDGPFAVGSNRFGIRTLGAFNGNVTNNGEIAIEGNDSTGIALDGPLTGAFTTDGTISVIGDRSVGVRTGDINGNTRIAGTIGARGQGAVGVSINGNVNGALVVQGNISSSGYRSTTAPSDTSKLDADDLLQGGPALNIAGDVTGGVILAVAPKDNDTNNPDEDKDGIEDSKEGSAAIASYGSAAAVQIGAADRSVTLGAVTGSGTGHGLVIDGAVLGTGVYSGVDAQGLVVGGLGGSVSIAGGMTVNGSVQASSVGGNATAMRIGNGATVNDIRVSGAVAAATSGGSGKQAIAIQVDEGASVGAVRNNGKIEVASGADGTATAILDKSGNLDLVENSGSISATGATADSGRNIAIDLRANAGGATVRQTAVTSDKTAPSITGDVLFGEGSDTFEIADGKVTGTTNFGGGADKLIMTGDANHSSTVNFGAGDDEMTMGDTSTFDGTADFAGGGADKLTLTGGSIFRGTLANSGGLAVDVQSGALDAKGSVSIASLHVGGDGALGVTIDPKAGTNTLYDVSGNASFDKDSMIAVRLTGVSEAEGRYTVIRAGSITGADNLTTTNTLLPYLYKSTIVEGGPTNEVALDIARKNATELELNGSQSRAYDAIYHALDKDEKVAGSFLAISDGDQFRRTLRQMLPDHAGGTFEAVTMGSRTMAGVLADPTARYADQSGWGFIVQQVGWGTSKSIGDTASYDITGWGIMTGAETRTGVGNLGLSVGYLHGKNADGGTDNEVTSNQYELAAHWRGAWGGLSARARASAAYINFGGERRFSGQIGEEEIQRSASGDWNGRLFSALGGVAYELKMGAITLRPGAQIDYYRLKEDAYTETGGGQAFNLIVDSRDSDELAVTGTVAAGIDFMGSASDAGWFRGEIEGGRRQLVGGALGETTARFDGGETFTLVPEGRTDGWVGKLRAVGGNSFFQLAGEFSAEEQQGRAAIALRASLVFGL